MPGPTTTRVGSTPSGRRLLVSRRADAPADAAWDLLTDTRTWPEWGPSVSAVDAPDRIQTGTTGRVQVLGGPWVGFEVTACEPYRWTWEVARVPATGHAVEQTGEGACRVVFEVPLVAAPYVPVCRRALGRIERLLAERETEN